MKRRKDQEFDPQTRTRIIEHLSKRDDTITEEDIRNVKTSLDFFAVPREEIVREMSDFE